MGKIQRKVQQRKLSGPAARKNQGDRHASEGGGDRVTAAYNERDNKDQKGLDQLLETTSDEKAPRVTQKLSAKHTISWTHERQRRNTSANAMPGCEATTKGKGIATMTVETPIALDEKDWSVPIAQARKKLPNGEYESSVSLHSMVGAEKWCSVLSRHKEPIAIVAIGTGNAKWAHVKIQIPVLKVPHGAQVPRKAFMDGVVYQLGESEVIHLQAQLAQVALEVAA